MNNEKIVNVVYNLVKLISMATPIANITQSQWFIEEIIKDCVKKNEGSGDVEVEFLLEDIKEKLPEHFPVIN